MIRSQAIKDSARDEVCTVHSDFCTGTGVVWAHSNLQIHGKGTGLKAHDIFGCYACSNCHAWLDEGNASREEKMLAFYRAMSRSWLRLVERGIIKVKA
jgi:hypothetical protein